MDVKSKIKELAKNKKIIIASAIVIIGAGVLLFNNSNKVQYQTKDLERCTITQVVEASGTINPVNIVSVGSTVSGLMKAIYVDYNSEVKKGQLLAQIDPATFQAQVDQQRAQINNAQANLARLNAEMVYSQKTYQRYKNLYSKNFIAKSELDKAESEYYAKLASIGAQKASISQAQASYKTSMTNLGYTKIIAPVDGTIIKRAVDVGQPVAASFHLDGYPDATFHGVVTQVRLNSTTTSNVVTYTVIVSVDNEDLKLKPGMTANVSIITSQNRDVLCVPSVALKYTPETTGQKYKEQGVWVLEKNEPVRIPIKEGASDDSNVQIITNKLKVGDKIIVGSTGKTGKAVPSGKCRGGPPGLF